MRNIRIFQDQALSSGSTIQLDKIASNHLLKVLRLRNGHSFNLFCGDGYDYPATLEVNGKFAIAHLHDKQPVLCESPVKIHLYQGISKGDRMDFAIQKSVELGVDSITPVFCNRTVVNLKGERLEKKISHWQAIAISACEQSGRAVIPPVNKALTFDQSIQKPDKIKLILDPYTEHSFTDIPAGTTEVSLLIGPEGGLTTEEISRAVSEKFISVRLGPRILRTETAAIASITVLQTLIGDLR